MIDNFNYIPLPGPMVYPAITFYHEGFVYGLGAYSFAGTPVITNGWSSFIQYQEIGSGALTFRCIGALIGGPSNFSFFQLYKNWGYIVSSSQVYRFLLSDLVSGNLNCTMMTLPFNLTTSNVTFCINSQGQVFFSVALADGTSPTCTNYVSTVNPDGSFSFPRFLNAPTTQVFITGGVLSRAPFPTDDGYLFSQNGNGAIPLTNRIIISPSTLAYVMQRAPLFSTYFTLTNGVYNVGYTGSSGYCSPDFSANTIIVTSVINNDIVSKPYYMSTKNYPGLPANGPQYLYQLGIFSQSTFAAVPLYTSQRL